jgi:anthranilate phosphoribosyltransferase
LKAFFIFKKGVIRIKAALLDGPGSFNLKEIPTPDCPLGGLLIKVQTCAICSADVKMIDKGHKALKYPRIPGHEISGIILKSKSKQFKEGDRVQISPGLICGECKYCRKDITNQCEDIDIIGFTRDGGFAEYLALPAQAITSNIVNILPDNLSFKEAALAEPLACCINGQQLVGVCSGDVVLILGAGPIGCFHAMLSRVFGASKVIIADKLKNRLDMAVLSGADLIIDLNKDNLEEVIFKETKGLGADVVLLSSGNITVNDFLINLMAPRGRISLFCGMPKENPQLEFNGRTIHYKELNIVGAYGCTAEQNKLALQLMSEGKIKTKWMITDEIGINEIVTGVKNVKNCIGLKTIINFMEGVKMTVVNKDKQFGAVITRLINKENISRAEMKELFSEVLLNEQNDMQQGAFLSALTSKKETTEEIAACWEAIYEIDTVKVKPETNLPLVENSGTGMDSFKTFNISTCASIIAASAGVKMAKHGSRAITSVCGTVDILEEFGVDVECSPEHVKKSIEKTGIGLFNGMSPNVHPQALGRILSQINFGTTLNIAASLANPVLPDYGVRGVYSKELVEPVAEVMKEIGYKKAIVVHGFADNGVKGMDEASTIGETIIAELSENGKISKYSFLPEELGINTKFNINELKPLKNKKEEAMRLIALLKGLDKGPRADIVCLNAALILYLMDIGKNIKESYQNARDILFTGQAINKLENWVVEQNSNPNEGLNKFNTISKAV